MSILDETLSTGELNVGSSNPSSSLLSSSENISTDNLDTNTSEELDSQQEESVEILATDNMELAEISLSGDAGVSHTELEGQINTIGGGIDTVVVGTTPYTVQHPGDNYVTIPAYPTREGLGITELEDDVEALTERVDALAGDAGEHDLPIYIENGETREIDALDVDGYVIGRGGVAAYGIGDLTSFSGGGGGGTVNAVKMNDDAPIFPDEDGVINLGTVITEHQSLDDYYTKGETNALLDGKEDAHPYLSLERICQYLYRVTFDSLPEDNGGDNLFIGACSSFVRNGKLYRNLDFKYDNAASFIVHTRDFIGMSFITGLNDGNMDDAMIAQLPYRMVDGRNNNGIMVSTHVLYNDFQWSGGGNRSIPLTRLPYLVLTKVKSMETISVDLADVLGNLAYVSAMGDYLIQVLVTDGTTTYVIAPPLPESNSTAFVLINITAHPKLANFRWVNRGTVTRSESDIQERPTGIERFNMMLTTGVDLEALKFTLAYEAPDRLSEFIGIRETTKDSTDEELEVIYNLARAAYLDRKRDGETWHTMHSVVYGNGMERLNIQEDWDKNYAENIQLEFIPTSYINALSFD